MIQNYRPSHITYKKEWKWDPPISILLPNFEDFTLMYTKPDKIYMSEIRYKKNYVQVFFSRGKKSSNQCRYKKIWSQDIKHFFRWKLPRYLIFKEIEWNYSKIFIDLSKYSFNKKIIWTQQMWKFPKTGPKAQKSLFVNHNFS